jgi:hypothetical protein
MLIRAHPAIGGAEGGAQAISAARVWRLASSAFNRSRYGK